MTKEHNSPEESEQAALYALGVLTPEEASAFEVHLHDGCQSCSTALGGFEDIVSALRQAAKHVAPPSDLYHRLLERLKDVPQESRSLPPILTVREQDRVWKDTAYPGIQVCRLFDDATEGIGALIVKMTAGAAYPDHQHKSREQFYVIQGDVRVGPVTLHAGDYHRADAGTTHEEVSTEFGCMCIILGYIGSMFDPKMSF